MSPLEFSVSAVSQNCQKKKGSGNAEGNLGLKQQHIGRRMDESPPGWFLVAFITHLHMKKIMQGDVCTTSVVGHDSSYPTGHLCFRYISCFKRAFKHWLQKVSCSPSPAFCATHSRLAPQLPPGVLRTHQRPRRFGFLVRIPFWATGSP